MATKTEARTRKATVDEIEDALREVMDKCYVVRKLSGYRPTLALEKVVTYKIVDLNIALNLVKKNPHGITATREEVINSFESIYAQLDRENPNISVDTEYMNEDLASVAMGSDKVRYMIATFELDLHTHREIEHG